MDVATSAVVAVVVGFVVTDGSVQPRQVSGQLIKVSASSHISRLNDGLEHSSASAVDPQVSSTTSFEHGSTVVTVAALVVVASMPTSSVPEPSVPLPPVSTCSEVSVRLGVVDVVRTVSGSTVALDSVVSGKSVLRTASSPVGFRFGVWVGARVGAGAGAGQPEQCRGHAVRANGISQLVVGLQKPRSIGAPGA